MDRAWVGIDVGKEFHWAHVLDASGRELLSRRLENDESEISKLIDEALCAWQAKSSGRGRSARRR